MKSRQIASILLLLIVSHALASNNSQAFLQRSSQQHPPSAKPDVEIEVMWSVLPPKIAKDNFGERVSNSFYVVEIVIGNNTANGLLVTDVGIKLASGGQVPFASFQIVQQSIRDKSQLLRLCSFGFRGNLLVDSNHQVRTHAFFPRALLGIQDKKARDNPQEVRKLIADIFIVGRKLAAVKTSLPSK
jgi:hypothetical protein